MCRQPVTILLTYLVCSILIAATAHATVRTVPIDYATIQAAVDACVDGDTVTVSPGTYTEAVVISGKLITLQGTDVWNDAIVNTTIIDSPNSSPAITVANAAATYSDMSYVKGLKLHSSGTGVSVGVGHLWVQHCHINDCGGNGVTVTNSGYTSILSCDLQRNAAGIIASNSWMNSMHNNVIGNTGVGVQTLGALGTSAIQSCDIGDNGDDGVVSDCSQVSSNYVHGNVGGGIVAFRGWVNYNVCTGNQSGLIVQVTTSVSARVFNNLFHHNSTALPGAHGGGAYVSVSGGGSVTFTNNTLVDNTSPNGGGMYCYVVSGSSLDIRNNLITSNSGYGILGDKTEGNVTIDYNDLWGNSIANSIGCDSVLGSHNLAVDPIYSTTSVNEYRLQSTAGHYSSGGWVIDAQDSPCIDAGDPASSIGSESEPNGHRINLGRDGGMTYASKTANKTPTRPTTITIKPSVPGPEKLTALASGSTDANPGDTLTYLYEWSVSRDQGHTWSKWNHAGSLLPQKYVKLKDWWRVRAKASDSVAASVWRIGPTVRVMSMFTSRAPAPDATGVARRPSIVVTFRWPVKPRSAEEHFRLKLGSADVPGTFTWVVPNTKLKFVPSAQLAASTLYTVKMTSGTVCVSGRVLGWIESWNFTTAALRPAAMLTATADPSAGGVQITTTLSAAAAVQATVCNLAGRTVATLAERDLPEGTSTLLWNRKSAAGLSVPGGQYLVRVTARTAEGGQTSAVALVRLP